MTTSQVEEKRQALNIVHNNRTQFRGFDCLSWVAKLAGKPGGKVNGYDLHGVMFRDGVAISSDGYRLHACDFMQQDLMLWSVDGNTINPAELSGFYEVVKLTKKLITLNPVDDVRCPRWENVFPPHKDYQAVAISGHYYHDPSLSLQYAKIIRKMDDRVTINYRYFEDAFFNDDGWTVYLYGKAYREPVCFMNGCKFGAIMPMK